MKANKKNIVAAGVLVLCFIFGTLLFFKPSSFDTGASKKVIEAEYSDDTEPSSGAEVSELNKLASKFADLEPLPEHMNDTDIDAYFELDEYGNLIPGVGLKALFDYFFSTGSDESHQASLVRIAKFLTAELSEEHAAQAWDFLNQYADYLNVLEDSVSSMPENATLRERNDFIRAIRDQELGADIREGFFGEEEIYDLFTLERLDILENEELSEDTKQALLSELESNLPEHLGSPREELKKIDELESTIEQMRNQGASENELLLYFEESFGEVAAQRLKQLNEEEDKWNNNYNDYRQELTEIENSTLSEYDKQKEIELLFPKYFQSEEQGRVEASDSILK